MAKRKNNTANQPDLFDGVSMVGAMANCKRCDVRLQVAPSRNGEAWPFRLAKTPNGFCANCVVTEFLYNAYPINMQLDKDGPRILLHPQMRQAFHGIIESSDMRDEEINWELVVENWSLPVCQKRGPTNPYTVGDYAKGQLAAREYEKKNGFEEGSMDGELFIM